ncbi:MAG: V-type ATPase subunit, partial [Candidatus Nanohaloarchaea archaeon]
MNVKQRIAGMKNYAYTNARVRAMRGNLITDQEYRKLSKMDLAEIAEFLENRGYREEIDELGADHRGAELIERAVRQNLAATYRKLMRISPEPVQELLSLYYRAFDIENLKIVLRQVVRGGEGDIDRMITPTPRFDAETVDRLAGMDDPGQVLEAVTVEGFDGDLRGMVDDPSDLAAVEDALDSYYYTNLVEQIDRVGVNSDLFREFLQLEAALTNISLILR